MTIRFHSGFWKCAGRSLSCLQQLRRSGLDDAAPRLLISRRRAEFEDLSRQTKSRSSLEGYCYHHVQAIIVAIDQCAVAALGSRKYFLNRPLRAG